MTIALTVHDESEIAETRRRAVAAAERCGLDATEAGRVAIIATELASNIIKHARGGEILLSIYEDRGGAGVEMIALDKGPGMADVTACMTDGYSTAGSAGQGLGAIKRLATDFDLVSWPSLGTAVLVRVGRGGAERPSFAAVSVAKAGEEVCGDSYLVMEADGDLDVLVCDGLGHGAGAAAASAEAVRLFRARHAERPQAFVQAAHLGLRPTRGAALAVARIRRRDQRLVFCGLGNIAGLIGGRAGETRRLVSHNGTAGLAMHKVQEFEHPFGPDSILVMHSDGLATSWSLDRYPGLEGRHPGLIAGVLYRDHNRGRDDATVLVAGGAT